ncbi:MAG TPA: hypothetical protein PK297_13725, partial [Spirochaetota bacterium]|nr:hypothetical protein [Spirochaetota bacterium]
MVHTGTHTLLTFNGHFKSERVYHTDTQNAKDMNHTQIYAPYRQFTASLENNPQMALSVLCLHHGISTIPSFAGAVLKNALQDHDGIVDMGNPKPCMVELHSHQHPAIICIPSNIARSSTSAGPG